ncbi:MAG: sigma-70 family RNA polymerase sigma factor [Candidatus Hydrogenedentes bacterium]|nr:sigma-70 family RNA polymerase sigma factor [Candidatus Hydrogenedentota bacterium]
MSAELEQWVQASLKGDKQAFGHIVERYQGAVCAMAYSVTGDLRQSEDLAQETFLVAWQKLASLRKRESLPAWMCSIARNLSREWLRKQSRLPTVPLEHAGAAAAVAETAEEAGRARDRADAVWTALAAIPETYREPLVLYYRHDKSIRHIAEALGLTEACVKQRLSRGRNMLRAEVARMVEDTLEDTRPGKRFTAGVLAVLPALPHGAHLPTQPHEHWTGPVSSTPLVAMKFPALAAALLLVLAGGWAVKQYYAPPDKTSEDTSAVALAGTAPAVPSTPGTAQAEAPLNTMSPPSAATAAPSTGITVTGQTVFRGGDTPASNMRVLLASDDRTRYSTLSNDTGHFSFENVTGAQCAVVAYDAAYDEIPEDDFRSDHIGVELANDSSRSSVRVEVPARGGRITGRVHDSVTDAPLPGVTVSAIVPGKPSPAGISNSDGRFEILGVPAGTSLVRIDNESPVFASDQINKMLSVHLEENGAAELDFAIDTSMPVEGRVVNAEGKAVSKAWISADRSLADGSDRMYCRVRTRDDGTFTLWGALGGDRVVLVADHEELSSPYRVLNLIPGKPPEAVSLTLGARARVVGRFVDESGAAIKANFWSRPTLPEGDGNWRGQSEDPASTFEATMPPGDYEIKGMLPGGDFGVEQPVKVIHVADSGGAADLTVKVNAIGELSGKFSLRGTLTDESKMPLPNQRVYISGGDVSTRGSFHETYTSEDGVFSFDRLLDGRYQLHATLGDPYEDFAGFENFHPADSPVVTIVARHAARLTGQVTDAETGAPVTRFVTEYGALMPDGRENRWDKFEVVSDVGGFDLRARLDEDWYLRVSADGYTTKTQTGDALSAGQRMDAIGLRLEKGIVVHGMVTNAEGAPEANAFIYYNTDVFDTFRQPQQYAAAQSGNDGRFEIRSLPEDATVLYARKTGFAVAQCAVAENTTLVLEIGGSIEGHASVGGMALPGSLSVTAINQTLEERVQSRVDETGFYQCAGLMDAPYLINVHWKDDYTHQHSDYTLTTAIDAVNGMAKVLDIRIPDGNAAIEGVVSRAGVPVADVTVACEFSGCRVYVSSDDTGAYRVEGLPAGQATLIVYNNDGNTAGQSALTVEAASDATVTQDLALPEME